MKEIELSGKRGKGKFVKVDDDVYDWARQYKWCLETYKYNDYVMSRKRNQARIYLHKVIAKAEKEQKILFRNGNGLDCQRENLVLPDDWKKIPIEIDEATGAAKLWLNGKRGEGKYALVDKEDWERVIKWKWQLMEKGYAVRTGNKDGKQFRMLMHRLIMNPPKDMQVDHKNMKRLDNRKSNLRLCNNSQNNVNRAIQSNNTTGFKGIEKHPKKEKWRTKIVILGKRIYSKYYDSKIEAAKEYDRLARKYFGEFAKTNF